MPDKTPTAGDHLAGTTEPRDRRGRTKAEREERAAVLDQHAAVLYDPALADVRAERRQRVADEDHLVDAMAVGGQLEELELRDCWQLLGVLARAHREEARSSSASRLAHERLVDQVDNVWRALEGIADALELVAANAAVDSSAAVRSEVADLRAHVAQVTSELRSTTDRLSGAQEATTSIAGTLAAAVASTAGTRSRGTVRRVLRDQDGEVTAMIDEPLEAYDGDQDGDDDVEGVA